MTVFAFENLEQLPDEWQASSVFRNLNAPFSDEAFGEPEKTCIDLGPVNVEACRGDNLSDCIKWEGREANLPPGTPPALIEAHELFLNSARLILGYERYLDSIVNFTYRDKPVPPGSRQIGVRAQLDKSGLIESYRNFGLRFRKDPVPIGRLILTPPALLHDGGTASGDLKEPVDRIFLRWQLRG